MATDVELVKAVLSGERRRFALLVQRHQRDIYNVAYRSTNNRQDAEDVTQETFLRAFRGLASYDMHRSFRTWLYTIAVNVCRDWVRARERRPQVVSLLESDGLSPAVGQMPLTARSDARHSSGLSDTSVTSAGPSRSSGPSGRSRAERMVAPSSGRDSAQPQDVVIQREMQREVQKAIMDLAPDYRLLVILFYMRDLPQAEIAEMTGLPLSVVKNRLYRARGQLRQMLGPALGEVK